MKFAKINSADDITVDARIDIFPCSGSTEANDPYSGRATENFVIYLDKGQDAQENILDNASAKRLSNIISYSQAQMTSSILINCPASCAAIIKQLVLTENKNNSSKLAIYICQYESMKPENTTKQWSDYSPISSPSPKESPTNTLGESICSYILRDLVIDPTNYFFDIYQEVMFLKGISLEEIAERSSLKVEALEDLFNLPPETLPSRNLAIALILGLSLNEEDSSYLLAKAGVNVEKIDLTLDTVSFCIKKGWSYLSFVNYMLLRRGLNPVTTDYHQPLVSHN